MTNIAIPKVDLEDLRTRLGYDLETGRFWWKVKPSKNRFAGDEAGCVSSDSGYVLIRFRRRIYRGHVLAWFLTTGEWPSFEVDHRNRIRSDNRFVNLRPASGNLNRANTGVRRHNKLGIKGVQKDGKRYVARITVDGQQRIIGRFENPQDAHEAYMAEARKAFGEFARAS